MTREERQRIRTLRESGLLWSEIAQIVGGGSGDNLRKRVSDHDRSRDVTYVARPRKLTSTYVRSDGTPPRPILPEENWEDYTSWRLGDPPIGRRAIDQRRRA